MATSIDLCLNPSVTAILGEAPGLASRLSVPAHDHVLGWGRRPSGRRAERIAQASGSKLTLLEDGFLRSFDRSGPSVSLVSDDTGIYYDSTRPSRLERLIAEPLNKPGLDRAEAIGCLWREFEVSKYNGLPGYSGDLPDDYVLVVDQVAGDLSIRLGGASQKTFDTMLSAALTDGRAPHVVVKVHPDAARRRDAGHFDLRALAGLPRVTVIADACHPVSLIGNAKAVYTVTSQIGFEALIWRRPVITFGAPFYAGWGLTLDRGQTPRRRGRATLEQVIHAALVRYPRYADPETGRETTPEAAMQAIGAARRVVAGDPQTLYAVGFSPWKRPALQRFMPCSNVRHVSDPANVPRGAAVAVWGNPETTHLRDPACIIRVEDGFLRSVGLGAELVQPQSWVFDDTGLHYDASRPSGLERILSHSEMPEALTAQAAELRHRIVRHGLSKYNIGGTMWRRPDDGRRVILVPGQVESDASLRYGAPQICRNIDLLRAVRDAHPDAHIVYKPHPDVIAGLRQRGSGEEEAHRLADTVLTRADPAALLSQVDDVHVMTSLLGFEALMRGLPVTTHGQPFYAGWGLTRDLCPIPRRTRRLTLDELVAGALVLYPRYVSARTWALSTPERVVEDLLAATSVGDARPPMLRQALRGVLRLWAASGMKRNA